MEVVNHSLWLMLSYQSLGFFFYLLYLYFQQKNPTRLIFSLFMLSFGLASFLVHIHLFDHNSTFYILSPLVFCFALTLVPLFYIHHKSLHVKKFKFKRADLLHFIPAMAIVLFLIPFWMLLITNNVKQLDSVYGLFLLKGLPGKQIWLIEIIVKAAVSLQLIVYIFLGARRYKEYYKLSTESSRRSLSHYITGIQLFGASFVIMMLLLIAHRYIHTTADDISSTFFILSLLVLNIGLAYFGIRFEENYLFECRGDCDPQSILSPNSRLKDKVKSTSSPDSKYVNSCLCSDLKEELLTALIRLMKEEEPFTEYEVRIDNIADSIGTNKKYLSQLINEHFGKNFHSFMNDYRCKKVVKLFNDPAYDNYSIEGISETCGFRSRSTFVASFKKFSGELPSVYRGSLNSKGVI